MSAQDRGTYKKVGFLLKNTPMHYTTKLTIYISPKQGPITRSVQLAYFLATAFSQVGLFLDEASFCGYILHITVNYAITSDWLLKTNSWERLI